ncbi:hypothetical protein ML462_10510 [Gramella lutea]|uniref:Uncharacterized protein n=1 Tax=Christiangramia lutea TaxID=1607951 RepID=A0A9X2AAW3_9FLAO|nr:hypothetical protein [Christiangramia lutea]MCH4823601.1 hypothetical protein [Christiangramia lutea]
MNKISKYGDLDRMKKSEWLLNPARTRETILKYLIILILTVSLAYFII